MSTITLDDIRAAAEARYGSTDIDLGNGLIVRLLNPLRLSKTNRAGLSSLQEKLSADGADQELLLTEALRMVAETPGKAEILIDAIGGDLAVLAQVFSAYTEGTQAGEASASPA